MKSIQKIILIKVLVILFAALIVLNISQYNEIKQLKNNNNNNNNNENILKRELKVFVPNQIEITVADDSSLKIDTPVTESDDADQKQEEVVAVESQAAVESQVGEESYGEISTISDSTNNEQINEIVLPSSSTENEDIIIDIDNNVEFVKGDKPKYRFCGGCSKCNNHHNKKLLIISN